MEDTSYVNLSLQKYNELYDKAKKYDELIEKFGDAISKSIQDVIDNLDKIAATNDEKDTYYDVECIEDCECIPKGAKGKLLEDDDDDFPYVDWDECYKNCYEKEVDGVEYSNVYAVPLDCLKKLNKKKEEN